MFGLSKVNCHENSLMVGAAGALLKFIVENRLELAELDEKAILGSIKRVVHLDLFVILICSCGYILFII